MSFFDDLPARPKRPRQPKPRPPVWAGPPSDELPAVVSLGKFFHRSAQMVMAAKSVEVFSTGCLIEVVVSVRRADESASDWSRVTDQCFNWGPYSRDSEMGREGALRFGVAFPDGRKTAVTELDPGMFEGEEEVTGPVIMMRGGGSGNDDELSFSIRFWLWPLPLGGDTRVVAQWEDFGMKESAVLIAGEQLETAAEKVQKYWVAPLPG